MKNDTLFKNRTKVLSKLYDAGYTDESKILKLDIVNLLQIPDITVGDMRMIVEFQKYIKIHRFYSYLGGRFDDNSVQED